MICCVFCTFSYMYKDHKAFFPPLFSLELFQNQGTNTYTVKWMNYSDSSSCYLMNNPVQTYCSHLRYKNSFRSHTGRGQLEVMWEGVSMGTVMSKWGRVQGPRAVMQFVPLFVRITVEIKGRTYNRIDYTWPNEDLVWNRPPGKKGRRTKMLETYIFNILLNYSLKVLHFLQTQPRLGLYLSPFLHWLLWVSMTVALIKSQRRHIKNISNVLAPPATLPWFSHPGEKCLKPLRCWVWGKRRLGHIFNLWIQCILISVVYFHNSSIQFIVFLLADPKPLLK